MGEWTRPDPGLYIHQWLRDSFFAAIGKRHYDIERAKVEAKVSIPCPMEEWYAPAYYLW